MSDNILTAYKENYSINASGVETYNNVAMIYKAEVAVTGSTFTLDFGGLLTGDVVRIHAYTGDTWQEQINAINIEQVPFSFTVGSNIDNIRISIRKTATDVTMTDGQYKIPILSAGQTTNVYLGEVQTTRQIRQVVLTGQETYVRESEYDRFYTEFPNAKITGLRLTQAYCTHFLSVYDGRPLADVPNNSIYSGSADSNKFYIKTTNYTTVADFTAYLARQYAAGTPVTVWYVLATPTTGIVNEPLRKIGTYADEVSGITIPTIAGANTLSIDTTLQPSEVTVNYKGWHPVTDVHERDNGAWT